ncbi:Protein of unknown function DUF1329 [gamma proteobacterium HdN1]|nr:Protein of unknown function DUF1329 [gamma proteobacterium HdN1]
MRTTKPLMGLAVLIAALASAPVFAKVGADEAAKLGKTLTPNGAEKAGNADGSIPAWDGGLTKAPACFKPGDSFRCDPFPDDKPLFVITNENKGQYKDKLSVGLLAMLEKYPTTFKIPVYQTRRTAAFPPAIDACTLKNATTTELTGGGNGVTGMECGTPFPIPKDPHEYIWNHILRYRGDGAYRVTGQVTPQPNGAFSLVLFHDMAAFRTGLTDFDPAQDANILFYFKQEIVAPARLAGNVLLVHETIDQVKEPRRAWIYNAGQRRVRRAPQVAYDGPGTAADGMRTADNFDMYNGAPDRYNWEVIGKKEMYIPYNSYKMDDRTAKYKDIVKPGHLNPDYTRFELHRVWVVDAKLKPGTRHIYARRTFYIDEDTWQAGLIDHYDGRGNLWRVGQAYEMQYYDANVPWMSVEALYDLNASRYIAIGPKNEEKQGVIFKKFKKEDFSPNSLRATGVR